jgi:hypothetical protein
MTSLRYTVTQDVTDAPSASSNHLVSHVTGLWSESSVAMSPTTTDAFRFAEQFESREPAILKVVLMCIVILVNLFGNGASLVVIWKTPKLHTTTFALLFNLTVVDLVAGLTLIGYCVFTVVVYIIDDDPCAHLLSIAVMIFLPRYPIYVSMNSVGLIAYERYIAIALPLRYGTLVTDKTVKIAVALVWILCMPLTIAFLFIPDGIDWASCSVVDVNRKALVTDVVCLLTAFTLIGGLYVCIFVIAWRQRAKINAQVKRKSLRRPREFGVKRVRL